MTDIEKALMEADKAKYLGSGKEAVDYYDFTVILAQAYREQETRIKELERERAEHDVGCKAYEWQPQKDAARIKELESLLSDRTISCENCNKQTARIAALELALQKATASMDGCQRMPNHGKWHPNAINIAKQAISGSKLGELFQALMEEHRSGMQLEWWDKVEALRKECGI